MESLEKALPMEVAPVEELGEDSSCRPPGPGHGSWPAGCTQLWLRFPLPGEGTALGGAASGGGTHGMPRGGVALGGVALGGGAFGVGARGVPGGVTIYGSGAYGRVGGATLWTAYGGPQAQAAAVSWLQTAAAVLFVLRVLRPDGAVMGFVAR